MSTEATKVNEASAGYSATADAQYVPPGYKRTEAGVIPEDWHVTSLRAVADLEVGYAFKSAWFRKHDGVPLLRGENVGYGHPDWSDTRRLPEQQAARFAPYRLRPGDVVIGMDRTFTKSGTKMSVLQDADCPCLLVQRVGRFTPKKCDGRFLWAVLSSARFQQSLLTEQKGMDIPHLSRSEILRPLISLPPNKTEQRAIAEALSDVDGLLGALEALIAKKRAIKQAAMQQLLTGKTRLPGFSGEWETKRLGDLGHWRGGSTPLMSNRAYWLRGTIPWLSSSDVRQGWINILAGHITEQAIAETSVPLIPPDSVIVVIRSGILRRFLPVARCSLSVAINQDLRALLPGPYHDPQFLVHALVGFERMLLLDCLKAGTTVESIDSSWFRGFEITMPSIEEQTAIATVLSDMDAEIAALERRRDKTRAIKQGMMQQLLTGKTRLAVAAN